MSRTTAVVALGSNLGDSMANLQRAVDLLPNALKVSRVYTTAPMYVTDQPPFLNAAVLIETEEAPWLLLQRLKSVEREIGRFPRRRYGPREIDLDLVAYDRLSYRFIQGDSALLQIPHPLTKERRFVLQPVCDLDPELVLPGLGVVKELLKATESQAESVILMEDAVLSL